MNPDYLPTLRERYGPDAGTRAPQGGPVHTSSIDHPDPTRPWIAHLMPAPDAPDPLGELDADDYDPDYDLDLCGPDGAGEWLGHRRVEVVQPAGEFL